VCFQILPVRLTGVKIVLVGEHRPYGGIDARDRIAARRRKFLEAGLDLLGAAKPDTQELTVRALCARAGLSAKYFYETFTDKDELVAAVCDWVINDLATTTQAAAVAAVDSKSRSRAVMAEVVRTVADDARIGRLLFSSRLSNAVVMRKRAESGALFAMLSGEHASAMLRTTPHDRIKAAAHFAVGGVTQVISAWLVGDVRLEPDDLVEQLARILDDMAARQPKRS
jgi:AcrR family transcriptional regulator